MSFGLRGTPFNYFDRMSRQVNTANNALLSLVPFCLPPPGMYRSHLRFGAECTVVSVNMNAFNHNHFWSIMNQVRPINQ